MNINWIKIAGVVRELKGILSRPKHVCVTTIHDPLCTYRPPNNPDVFSWNTLNYEWCKAFCCHLNVTGEIIEARKHIVKV